MQFDGDKCKGRLTLSSVRANSPTGLFFCVSFYKPYTI